MLTNPAALLALIRNTTYPISQITGNSRINHFFSVSSKSHPLDPKEAYNRAAAVAPNKLILKSSILTI